MNKYKYYNKTNKKKETVGVVEAKNKELAITKAAINKRLPVNKFTMLFDIEKI